MIDKSEAQMIREDEEVLPLQTSEGKLRMLSMNRNRKILKARESGRLVKIPTSGMGEELNRAEIDFWKRIDRLSKGKQFNKEEYFPKTYAKESSKDALITDFVDCSRGTPSELSDIIDNTSGIQRLDYGVDKSGSTVLFNYGEYIDIIEIL